MAFGILHLIIILSLAHLMSCKQYFLKIDDLIRFRYLILTKGWLVRSSIIGISNSPKPSSSTNQYPLEGAEALQKTSEQTPSSNQERHPKGIQPLHTSYEQKAPLNTSVLCHQTQLSPRFRHSHANSLFGARQIQYLNSSNTVIRDWKIGRSACHYKLAFLKLVPSFISPSE